MTTLKLNQYKSIAVLTGAGISVASGLRSYRGPDGLWNDPATAKLSTVDNFAAEPDAYWRFWGEMRKSATEANPNDAHHALANWESKLDANQKLTLITQNIDRLHQRAGSKNVAELHGSIFKTRCSDEKCKLSPYEDTATHSDGAPKCPNCKAALRPDIVLFGEMLPVDAEWLAKKSLRDCDLFIAIGTSGTVSPASRFVEWAKYAGARAVLVNLEKSQPAIRAFDDEIVGKAEEVLPMLLQ